MAVEKLPFGMSLAGLLVDGVAETPYAGSTLRMEEPNGAVIEVPYIQHDTTGQFEPVQAWFSTRTPPENMLLKTAEGDVSLFEVQWLGHSVKSGHGVSLGKLRPTEIVLARREADLSTPLLVSEVRSHIDGLKEWSGFSAVNHERKRDDNGLVKKVVVEVASLASVEWSQGDATMILQTDWRTANAETPDDPSFGIFDWVVLDSRFAQPAQFSDHLVEQRKVVHLLVLVFDGAIHFRKHRIRDEAFAVRYGTLVHRPFVELISRRTVHEYAEMRPTKADLLHPLIYLRQLGPDGLTRWAEAYETWKRFILPTVGVLGRRGVAVEDLVVSISMSLEAGGHLIGVRGGEQVTYSGKPGKPTTATYVYRCLHSLDIDWGDRIESIAGLARAAANTYNSIKHFDRGQLPDRDETYLVSVVLRQVVRLMVLDILDPSGELLKNFREEQSLWRIHETFNNFELRILDDGRWESAPRPEPLALPNGVTLSV